MQFVSQIKEGCMVNDNSFFLDGDQMVPSIYNSDNSFFDDEEQRKKRDDYFSQNEVDLAVPDEPDKSSNMNILNLLKVNKKDVFMTSMRQLQQTQHYYYISSLL